MTKSPKFSDKATKTEDGLRLAFSVKIHESRTFIASSDLLSILLQIDFQRRLVQRSIVQFRHVPVALELRLVTVDTSFDLNKYVRLHQHICEQYSAS